MQQQAFDFNTLSARISAEVDIPGKEMSSRVDLKIVKDSALLLSVQPLLGMEVFRVEMSVDSLLIVDRMNRIYCIDSYNNLKGEMPLTFNFYNLQALFINNLFIPGEKGIASNQYNRFKLRQEGVMAEAQIVDPTGMIYTFLADGEEKILSTFITDRSAEYALHWGYADFRMIDQQPFPMLMDARLLLDGVRAGGIKLSFSKLQRDVPVNIRFSVPDKYRQITFEQLLKSLNSTKK
ncbi:DUF4292 domain-containing protein [Parabacteroides sp. OttesenSCG-928-N08]|nr:DUF4292 domain-containing protein [Parabacteroides sp. OttesenSCG-928-N08]